MRWAEQNKKVFRKRKLTKYLANFPKINKYLINYLIIYSKLINYLINYSKLINCLIKKVFFTPLFTIFYLFSSKNWFWHDSCMQIQDFPVGQPAKKSKITQ